MTPEILSPETPTSTTRIVAMGETSALVCEPARRQTIFIGGEIFQLPFPDMYYFFSIITHGSAASGRPLGLKDKEPLSWVRTLCSRVNFVDQHFADISKVRGWAVPLPGIHWSNFCHHYAYSNERLEDYNKINSIRTEISGFKNAVFTLRYYEYNHEMFEHPLCKLYQDATGQAVDAAQFREWYSLYGKYTFTEDNCPQAASNFLLGMYSWWESQDHWPLGDPIPLEAHLYDFKPLDEPVVWEETP